MTFDEYQKVVLRTASMGISPELEMCVRALGLAGECQELKGATFSERIKEAGDVLWYAATLAAMFPVDLGIGDLDDLSYSDPPEFIGMTYSEIAERAQDAACMLAELVKKHVGHKKPADPLKVKILLRRVLEVVAVLAPATMSEVAECNVEKLKARYPAGFDTAIASKLPTHMLGAREEIEAQTALPAGLAIEWKPGPV